MPRQPAPAALPVNLAAIYTAANDNVNPPLTIAQTFPAYRGRVERAASGAIEILIDAKGEVVSTKLKTPTRTPYDGIALAAARDWKYQPATIGREPVKYKKTVRFTITPSQ